MCVHDSGKYPYVERGEAERMNFEACFVDRPLKQNSGVSHKMLLEGEETGKFHQQ